jgi:hypothetical protein
MKTTHYALIFAPPALVIAISGRAGPLAGGGGGGLARMPQAAGLPQKNPPLTPPYYY